MLKVVVWFDSILPIYKQELNAHNARVTFVVIANGGKTKLKDEKKNAELLPKNFLASGNEKGMENEMSSLKSLGGRD